MSVLFPQSFVQLLQTYHSERVRTFANVKVKGCLSVIRHVSRVALCWRSMHAILQNLLFYCHQTNFLPAGYLCIDSTLYMFGSCPSSTFKILCCKGGIDCYSPVFLSFDTGFQEFCNVDFEEEPACLWDILWSQICQGRGSTRKNAIFSNRPWTISE